MRAFPTKWLHPSPEVRHQAQTAEALFDTDTMVGEMIEDEAITNGLKPAVATTDGTIEITVAFDLTAACPLGGEIGLAGEMSDSFDFSTRTRVTDIDASKTLAECVFEEEGEVLTVNSDANLQASRRLVSGRPDGLQTKSYAGSITAVRASDGETLTCDFEVRSELDPDAHTYTVVASICGDEFTKTVSGDPGGWEPTRRPPSLARALAARGVRGWIVSCKNLSPRAAFPVMRASLAPTRSLAQPTRRCSAVIRQRFQRGR